MNRRRATILNTAVLFGFCVIFLRLADLMVVNHAMFAEKAKGQQMKAEEIQVRRGNIFDARGRELAINMELESLYCDPSEVKIENSQLLNLARITGLQPAAIQSKLTQAGRFCWINRKLEPEKADMIRKMKIRGLGFVSEAQRIYPRRQLAAHVIGAVGFDNQALEGIELRYNKDLTTSGGKVYLERDAKGGILSQGIDLEAKGNNIVLTIDEGLQYIVEKELERAMEKWNSVAAAAVMMDPFTGEIKALANRPAFDPNALSSADPKAMRNRLVTDIYEPGSTFKIVVGTGALEEKVVQLNSLFDCSRGYIEVGPKRIKDAHRHGVLNFEEVIAKSSNVGTIMIGQKLGKERIYKYAKLFGFGQKTGLDLPGEVPGWVRDPAKWSATSLGAIPIGQEVAVTPLQVLRAYSAIANGGNLVQPHVVSEIWSPDGALLYSFTGTRTRIISERTAVMMREILQKVVEEGGTATGAAVEGDLVAGKTGTAQLIDRATGKYSSTRFISSFVGFVPADAPKFALIVVIYEPKGQIYGGVVAGPVFRDISEQALSYLNVPRSDDNSKKILTVSNEPR